MSSTRIVCFHNPDEENGYLSNWYRSEFTLNGVRYSSLEQYMMHQKALCFGDSDSAAKILAADDPGRVKALGRGVAGYDNHVWNGVRQIIVYEGLLAKFSQNADLKEKLLATGSDTLAECAVNDTIWGIGLSMRDPDRLDPKKWRGQGLLGYALMQVRAVLRRQEA